MEFTAQQISDLLKGTLVGDPGATVNRLSKIEEGEPGSLSFLANPKYNEFIYSTKASVVIVNDSFEAEQPVSATLIRVADAYGSFAKLLEMYNLVVRDKKGVEKNSFVSDSATVGKDCYIGAFAYVGNKAQIGNNVKIYPNCYVGDNVRVGDNTTLFPGVKVYSDCTIGKDCTLHAGVIVGADGFGFAPSSGEYNKVAQIGNVVIEDQVEIGAGTAIDRATLGSTFIRKGVKLDNLIQIAHNCDIGENTVIAAQTGVAGSTKIGRNCMIGGQVGIVGHLTIPKLLHNREWVPALPNQDKSFRVHPPFLSAITDAPMWCLKNYQT
jgi:UDP-3-O-[3-hydroxymyristoyl] glucosamine N-acyltransferase